MLYTQENIRKMPDNKLVELILSSAGTRYYSVERSTLILMVCLCRAHMTINPCKHLSTRI
jgi:hypothetical protein